MKNVLIVAAHPDDELLGCGGTIIKHIEKGDKVFVCIVTVSDSRWGLEYKEKKIEEAKIVDEHLGITQRFYCNLPTTALNSLPSYQINGKLKDVFDIVNPNVVYTHFGNDVNEDHRVIFNSVLVCARPVVNPISVRCFETLSSTEWGGSGFFPNFYVVLQKKHLLKKAAAFNIYESEVKQYPHPRSLKGIKNLAKKRGNDICKKYAEAFIIIKEYWE